MFVFPQTHRPKGSKHPRKRASIEARFLSSTLLPFVVLGGLPIKAESKEKGYPGYKGVTGEPRKYGSPTEQSQSPAGPCTDMQKSVYMPLGTACPDFLWELPIGS